MTGHPALPAAQIRLPGARQIISRAAAEQVWDNALCAQVDPELFFPEQGDAAQSRAARAVCACCNVQALCLATFGPLLSHGVVGGTTDAQRRQARRTTPDQGAAA